MCRGLKAPPPLLVVVRGPSLPPISVDYSEGANMRTVNLGSHRGRRQPALHHRGGRLQPQRGHGSLPKLIDAAAEAGANAVKFQSWTETSLIAKEEYDRNPELLGQEEALRVSPGDGARLSVHSGPAREARDHCPERGIAFCSSAFSPEEADLLEGLDVPFIKIASMDIVNLPLLHMWPERQALVISTGMATLGRSSRRSRPFAPRERADRAAPLRLHISCGALDHPPA